MYVEKAYVASTGCKRLLLLLQSGLSLFVGVENYLRVVLEIGRRQLTLTLERKTPATPHVDAPQSGCQINIRRRVSQPRLFDTTPIPALSFELCSPHQAPELYRILHCSTAWRLTK